ncbi:MAG: prepilin-type N-terminal cleavage/methylation domain-containing protein [Candidatus Moranbacteria bacterium]|nr:prepilin-type N-terminal cleavage/methylation domain-containing protein [Candidatus Moranbacteria bacterium]
MKGKRKQSGRKAAGFTLIELIVSIGVFAVMSVSLAAAFTSGFSTFGNSREIQHDVEAAQYSMNMLAKYLRTSTVIEVSAAKDEIRFYDYSAKRCFEYRFDSGGTFQVRWKDIALLTDVTTDCSSSTFGSCGDPSCSWKNLTPAVRSYVTGQFYATTSTNGATKSVGRVTVTMSVKKSSTAKLKSDIQTTVSLRDYDYVAKTP